MAAVRLLLLKFAKPEYFLEIFNQSSHFNNERKGGKMRTFGSTKKFRKMAKNLLTERLKRAIMYKLA